MNLIFVFFSTLVSALVGYLAYKYSYWESRGFPQLNAHFILGNILSVKSILYTELMEDVYRDFKGKAKVAGAYIFTKPIAVILDLEVVKAIFIKDFNNFEDRNAYQPAESDLLSSNLFHSGGDRWREMRAKITPTFTSGKMKFMFPMIVSVAKEFEEAFGNEVDRSASGSLELHDLMARYTTDVIGNCIFGIQCNSLKNPNVEFRNMGNMIFFKNYRSVRWRIFKREYSELFKFFGLKRYDSRLQDFFLRIVRETVTTREQQKIHRNDFVDLLIELRNKKDEQGKAGLTLEQMTAQMFIFFAAGYETSSSNMSYALFELAKNPHVQQKLRAEILEVLQTHNNELSYEAMIEMSYLDQVMTETLRKYPALGVITRFSKQDYDVPGTSLKLPKHTLVFVPVKEIHYDPDIYDNPLEFRPERFCPAEVQKRHPQAFLGFGDGPRSCIGLRFGRMQVKVGLISLLRKFEFRVSERMPNEVEMSKKSSVLVPANGVWVKAKRL